MSLRRDKIEMALSRKLLGRSASNLYMLYIMGRQYQPQYLFFFSPTVFLFFYTQYFFVMILKIFSIFFRFFFRFFVILQSMEN